MEKEKVLDIRKYSTKYDLDYDFWTDTAQRMWLFDQTCGIWCSDGENKIEKEIRDDLDEKGFLKKSNVSEVISDLRTITYKGSDLPDAPWELIPFRNGFYDLKDDSFQSYSPKLYFTCRLPINYNSKSRCSLIKQIFKELVPKEKVIDLLELAAYTLIRNYNYQRFFFLYGSGSNGKSLYANILTRLLGKENVSNISMADFQNNRFCSAELFHKMANISGEGDYGFLNKTDQIKKLTGGDYIRAEEKFRKPFKFQNYAKLIFLTNELPRTKDTTNAFFRRVHLIEFPNTFEGNKDDRSLLERINEEELEGFAIKLLEVAQGLRKRSFRFSTEQSASEIRPKYNNLSDPVGTFIEVNCTRDAYGYIVKEELRERLHKWMEDQKARLLSDRDIKSILMEKGIDDHRESGEGRPRVWQGIRWKSESDASESMKA